MNKVIDTTIFEIFKAGPGPSSSHTIGPMRAGFDFIMKTRALAPEILEKATALDVHLYGSLSLTGKGHGTDRSVLAGLLGWEPATCDSDKFSKLLADASVSYQLDIGGKSISFDSKNILFESDFPDFPFQNTMVINIRAGEKILFAKEYYSVGGGFIQCKGEQESERPVPPYPYSNMNELKKLIDENGISMHEIALRNELVLTGLSREEFLKKLKALVHIIESAVERGLNTEGLLPGPIKLARKAPVLYRRAAVRENKPDGFLILLNAYALAASEENAAGNKVVTAPTSGSAGVIPSVVYMMKHHFGIPVEIICDGLLVAAVIGFIAKHNASISGAEVGCQGEIGVASAMAAAFLASVNGHPMKVIENAAEIALEHHLGMTCDPIGGYVQIPCIERNAVGAVTAYNAYLLASAGDPSRHKITFDEVVEAMLETGKDMPLKYKETSRGGLAVCGKCS